ncbi:MAG: RHS repeat-associated core domain-containing protein, partial [Bacteroidota bacterium]
RISSTFDDSTARKGDDRSVLSDEIFGVNPCSRAYRLTELIDGGILHTGTPARDSLVTANATLWGTPARAVPTFWDYSTLSTNHCWLTAVDTMLNETQTPVWPFLRHPVQLYVSPAGPYATTSDFENIATYPEFARIAIAYDTLPPTAGTVWGNFPAKSRWDSLAPGGKLRNQKGHEAAVAYREHGGEPYHYNVLSYDERGRVEALLRYTENIGYDAVYYSYNSMNLVTAVRTCDLYRQYVSFYGYDHNGHLDSVWTTLVAPGGNYLGLIATNNLTKLRCPAIPDRPDSADIVYRYDRVGQVDSMLYPPVNVLVRYAYDHRKWLDSLVATKGTDTLFRQALLHDNAGQITRQISRQYTGGSVADTQQYSYDGAYRLTRFDRRPGLSGTQPITERYYYDKAGNRDSTVFDNHSTAVLRNDYTLAGAAGGRNRLAQTRKHNPANVLSYPGVVTYGYDSNGAVNLKQHTAVGGLISGKQEFVYSYRGLLRRLGNGNLDSMSNEVRYRYSPGGEREQKRLIAATVPDSLRPYPWVYYLLGAHNQQLAVYHGQQKNGRDYDCPDSGRRVYMYPFEYLTYGNGTGANISTDPNGAKEFHIMDHLGSTRVGLTLANVDQRLNYEPYGNQLPVTGVYNPREGYIGKEKDVETQLHDFGVRKYDDETGRFLSGDILWERHAGWTPYNYAADNPVRLTDPLGFDWLFFNGKELTWYGGNLGDMSQRLYVFKATSGDIGHQTAKEQTLKGYGPIPEGRYKINLAPSPYRFAPTTPDGSELMPNKTGGGIDKIPNDASDEDGNITDGWADWGNLRAALQPMKGTDTHKRGNFYLHDSHKGYSHGCIETETMVFVKLIQYRAKGNSEIQLKVEYPSPDASTNGGTKQ